MQERAELTPEQRESRIKQLSCRYDFYLAMLSIACVVLGFVIAIGVDYRADSTGKWSLRLYGPLYKSEPTHLPISSSDGR